MRISLERNKKSLTVGPSWYRVRWYNEVEKRYLSSWTLKLDILLYSIKFAWMHRSLFR